MVIKKPSFWEGGLGRHTCALLLGFYPNKNARPSRKERGRLDNTTDALNDDFFYQHVGRKSTTCLYVRQADLQSFREFLYMVFSQG